MNFGLLPKYIARLGSWEGAGRARSAQAGVHGRAGEGAGGSWALGERARCRRVVARGVRGQRAAGARAGTAWARGWAHGARRARPAWAWPGRWMGAQAGPAGPVLVHCAPCLVLARFLDPVRLGIFLSHQMNIVHCKINFRKKKTFFFKLNKIQIKFNKIFEK